MCSPFYFFNVMTVGTEANITGITIGGDKAIDLIKDLLQLLMAKKTAGNKLKAVAPAGQRQ